MQELETETRDYVGVTTEQIIVEMLTENTGRGICDSGDAYGRNWQRNQGKSFADQPVVSCTWSTWRDRENPKSGCFDYGTPEMNATVSLYHWMTKCLDFDPEMQKQLDEFAATEDMSDESWLGIQEHFAAHLHELNGGTEPNTINTYNDPDSWDCSQVLQYVMVYTDDSDYEPSHLIVSVHGGCDIRGGYTTPKCLKLAVEYYEALEKASVRSLSAGDHWWDYEGGSWSRGCEHSEDAPVNDIFDVPCYDIDWLYHVSNEAEDPALRDIADALARIGTQREALTGTTLTDEQRQVSNLQLDSAAHSLNEALFSAVVDLLGARHGACTLVYERRLFLIYTDNAGMTVSEEVTAYNDL